ncbi:MAG: hypothetical protein ACOC4E_01065 [Patescibacteria group bacterium]
MRTHKRTKKIYLPKWQRYFVVPFFIGIWLFMGYQEFFSPNAGEMGVVGFAFMSFIFLGVASMIWLMTSGKLPAYTMEEEVTDGPEQST